MPDTLDQKRVQAAVDRRLSAIEENPFLAQRIMAGEKGDTPVMKKKISVSVALILVLTMLTVGAALALVHSRIADEMYGKDAAAPQEVLDHIVIPEATAQAALGEVSVDEWLYDGSSLHLSLSVKNTTGSTLLYTVEEMYLGDAALERGGYVVSEGAGSAGMLLGGMFPDSYNVYNKSEYVHLQGVNGEYLGLAKVPAGKQTLKVTVGVWQPLNAPELVDYRQWEGYDVTETKTHLTADASGYCDLGIFRPQEAYRNYTVYERGCDKYAEVFKELGWALFKDTITLEVEVDLDRNTLQRAVPKETVYDLGDVRMEISRFDMTHAGGTAEGWLHGDYNAVKQLMKNGLCLADMQGNILSAGCWWDDQTDDQKGMHFTVKIAPVQEDLPTQVQLCPVLDWKDETLDTAHGAVISLILQ